MTKKNSTTTKKSLKKSKQKSNIMKHLYFSTNITHYYYHYIIKFASRHHEFVILSTKKNPRKKDAGRIPETETHSKKPDESQLYSSTILNIHLDDEQILYAKSTKKNKFAFF